MSQKLNIGIYADKFRLGTAGGVDTYFISLIQALLNYPSQHEFTVLAQPKGCEVLKDILGEHKNLHFYCLNAPLLFSRLVRVARRYLPRVASGEAAQIDRLGLDIISFPRSLVHVLDLRTSVALHLFDIQHEYFPEFFAPSVLAQRNQQYRASINRADLILASSQFTKQNIIDKTGKAADHIKVLYPGIDTNLGFPSIASIAQVRYHFNLPENFMFYPANPWIHKNHARLLAALRIIRERYGQSLPVVFTGRLASEAPGTLERLALAAGVEEQIFDLGFVSGEDLISIYGAARFMVFPSLFEGFGLPVLEAMACGCPVTCSNAASLPEVAGDAALLFDPMNIEAIAASILQMWNDELLRDQLRMKGFLQKDRFKWSDIVPQLIDSYAIASASTSKRNGAHSMKRE